MSSHSTGTEDRTHYEQTARGEGETDRPLRDRASRIADTATERDALGTAAMLGGGTLLASALRSRSGQHRAARGIAGVGLLGLGVAQRLAPGVLPSGDDLPVGRGREADVNPRGTGDEPPVDTKTPPDEGRVQFTDHQDEDPRPKPEADDGPHDPRVDGANGPVTVDLSTSAMADEESEATGPTSEQAMPTQTDPTEPDRTPPEDASHQAVDTPAPDEWTGNAPDASLAATADVAETIEGERPDTETIEGDGADDVGEGSIDEGEGGVGESEGGGGTSSDDEHEVVESVVAQTEKDEGDREDAFQTAGAVHPDDAESMADDVDEQTRAGDDVQGRGEVHPDDAEATDAETGETETTEDDEAMEDYEVAEGDEAADDVDADDATDANDDDTDANDDDTDDE